MQANTGIYWNPIAPICRQWKLGKASVMPAIVARNPGTDAIPYG
jgi:hypothetical protein